MTDQLPLFEGLPPVPPHREEDQAPTTAPGAVYIETYGCQMNVADSELVAHILVNAGYRLAEAPEQADVVLLNTCAVREHAEERVLGRAAQLNGLRRERPHLVLGIIGCMAQHLARELPSRAPFVDVVAGPDTYRRLPRLLAQGSQEPVVEVRLNRTELYADLAPLRRAQTNAWVPVIRGCNKFCAFCIVPFVRGRERCLPPAAILRQIEDLATAGFREVTLLGQTVNSYRHGDTKFARLLRLVAEVSGIQRIRFVSAYPSDFDDATVTAMGDLRALCRGLHLPVQSGSDMQLERMGRGYTVAQYRRLVQQLRDTMPDITLTTDIITGFCGESETDFEQTLALMEEIRFDSAFMFRYSERQGTRAQRKMQDDVPEAVKISRLERVIELQERISLQINKEQIGKTVEVLVEGQSKRSSSRTPRYYGRTEGGKVVVFPQPACANALVRVTLKDATSHTLFGDLSDTQNSAATTPPLWRAALRSTRAAFGE